MSTAKTVSLKEKADQIRKDVINVSVTNNAGHIAPSLSCVDILTALYYHSMSYRPEDPLWENRDRLIFSKGHGCYALYAILADIGLISKRQWENFYTEQSSLPGCVERELEQGIEAGCGSLGHGPAIATGIAFAAKLQTKAYHTFCIAGDGELQEGAVWEALQFAVKHELDNLTIIVDCNRLQAMDFTVKILDRTTDDLLKRLRGFGLSPTICPGHDTARLTQALDKAKNFSKNVPNVIIAATTKGYGLKCMENVPKFHFRIPTEEELAMGKGCQ